MIHGTVQARMRLMLVALVVGCGGSTTSSAAPEEKTAQVSWGERTCPGPYREGSYPVQDIAFGSGKANIVLPPVFALPEGPSSCGARTDVSLDGTPNDGDKIAMCGVSYRDVIRVTATAPLTVERDLTWTGTKAEGCNGGLIGCEPLQASSCHVVQRIVYPVDAPDGGR